MANYSQTSVSPTQGREARPGEGNYGDRTWLGSSDPSDRRTSWFTKNGFTNNWQRQVPASQAMQKLMRESPEKLVNYIIDVARYHNYVDADMANGSKMGTLVRRIQSYVADNEVAEKPFTVDGLMADAAFNKTLDDLSADKDAIKEMLSEVINKDKAAVKEAQAAVPEVATAKADTSTTKVTSRSVSTYSDTDPRAAKAAKAAKEKAEGDKLKYEGVPDRDAAVPYKVGGATNTPLLADRLYGSIKHLISNKFRINHTMVGGSNQSDAVVKNVYKRWATLHQDTKDMYKQFFQLFQDDKEIDPDNFGTDPCDTNTLRINIRKTNGGLSTVFSDALPLFPSDITKITLGGQDYTLNQTVDGMKGGDPEARTLTFAQRQDQCCPGGNLLLTRAYNAVRLGKTTLDIGTDTFTIPKSTQSASSFGVNQDDDVRSALYRIGRADRLDAASTDADLSKSSYLNMVDSNIWARAAPGVYTKTVNGVTVRYGAEDDATRDLLKAGNKCYSTLTKGDAAQCETYIWKCLLENDEESLNVCIDKAKLGGDFYKISRDEISAMHPLIALKTLQKFGFREVSMYDYTYGSQIRKVETKDHWLESDSLKKKFTDKQLAAIKGNDELLGYLDLVSQFVNANPQVLNSGFAGTTDEQTGHVRVADRLSSLGLKARVEPSRSSQGFAYRRLGTNMQTSFYGKTYSNSPFVPNSRGMLVTQAGGWTSRTPGLTATAQSGGGASVILRSFNEGAEGRSGAAYISQLVRSQLNDLPQSGRRLDESSRREIDRLLANLSKDEQTLMQIVALLEDYNRALSANREYKSETVTFGKMNDLVAKHKRVSTRHFNDQVSVQKMLASLCDSQTTGDRHTALDITR